MGASVAAGLRIYAFPASQLGIFGQPVGSAGQFMPMPPQDVLGASGASAALDGVQFDACDGLGYADSQCGVPAFTVYDASRNVFSTGSRPSKGVTIAVVNGQASASPGSSVPSGAQVAVQLWPTLVANGQGVASNTSRNATAEMRAALAMFSPTQLAFVIGAMPMGDFGDAIASLGATDAGYTDGGGSTALILPGGEYHGASERRRVPTWLVVNGVTGAAMTGGSAGVISVLLGALAVGVIYWATKKSPPRSATRSIRRTR